MGDARPQERGIRIPRAVGYVRQDPPGVFSSGPITSAAVRLQTDSGTAGTSSPADTWEFGLVQNGNNTSFDPALPGSAVLVPGSVLSAEAAGSRVRTSSFGVTTLAPGDRIRPYVANKNGAGRWYRAQSMTVGISILS